MTQPSAGHQVAVGVEILGLGKIGQDIILLIDERGVESLRPERYIDQRMPGLIGVIIQVVNPGTFHRPHIGDEVVDSGGIIAIFQQRILQPGLTDGELVYIGEGIGDQFERYMVEGPVGEFDRKGFLPVGLLKGLFHAVERIMVPVVVVRDVQAGARAAGCQGGEEEQAVYRRETRHWADDCGGDWAGGLGSDRADDWAGD